MTISDLYTWTSGVLALTEKVGTNDAWILAYDAVLSETVMDQAKRLGVTWTDPDLDPDSSYEDYVRAFCQGVEEVFHTPGVSLGRVGLPLPPTGGAAVSGYERDRETSANSEQGFLETARSIGYQIGYGKEESED